MAGTPLDQVLGKISRRHYAWFRYFQLWRATFWTCGIVGVGASVMAAAEKVSGTGAPYFAVVSSLCFAVIGFMNPQRRANAYVSAWRVLGTTLLRHEAGQCDISDVIAAMDRGEAAIGEADAATPTPTGHGPGVQPKTG